jgi:hypothetical protein
MTPPARTPGQRKHDALNRLDHDIDAWVATAGPSPDAGTQPRERGPGSVGAGGAEIPASIRASRGLR